MVKLSIIAKGETHRKGPRKANLKSDRYKRLACMGKTSVGIINELASPIDAVNRFINLTLQSIKEDSQSREFLLESKEGIRETLRLIKRLNNYAKRIEREIGEITTESQQGEYFNSE